MEEGAGHTGQRLGVLTCLHPGWFPLVQAELLPRLEGWLTPPPGPCQLTNETVPVRARDIYIALVPMSAQGATTQ